MDINVTIKVVNERLWKFEKRRDVERTKDSRIGPTNNAKTICSSTRKWRQRDPKGGGPPLR
jgi:hypothetical protein